MTWFNLGDRDLATHLYRTQRLAEGLTLTEVTAEITPGLGPRAAPAPDDRRPRPDHDHGRGRGRDRLPGLLRAPPARRRRHRRSASPAHEAATPSPAALARSGRRRAGRHRPVQPARVDRPGPGRARPAGRRVEARREDCVAVSPIIAGATVKGPADRLLGELGHDVVGRRRRPALRPAGRHAGHRRGRRRPGRRRQRRGHRGRRGPDDDVRPARGRRPRPGGPGVTVELLAGRRASPRSDPGDDIATLDRRRRRASGTATCSSSPRRSSPRPRAQLVEVDPDDPLAHKALVEQESVRVLRRRGDLVITETKHGFVCANAGIDRSNLDDGVAALLPRDSRPLGPPHPRPAAAPPPASRSA